MGDGKIYEEIEFEANAVKTLRKEIRDSIMKSQQDGLVTLEQQDKDKHGEEEKENDITKIDGKRKNEEKEKEEKRNEKEDDEEEEIQDGKEPDPKDDSKSSLGMKDHGQSKGMDQGKKMEPEKRVRDDRKKECWFWNNRICKYGENCRDVHPTQCKIWLESGRCHDRGCKLSHPEICRLIYDSAYCNRKNCWFIHPTNIPNRYVHNERRHTPPNNSNFTQQYTQKTNIASNTARWTQHNIHQNQYGQWNQQSNQNNQNNQNNQWSQNQQNNNQNKQNNQNNQNNQWNSSNQNNQWNSSSFLGQWPTPWESNKMKLQQMLENLTNTVMNM